MFFNDSLHSMSIPLVMADNKIGDDGARAIAEALKVNKSLQQLNVYGAFS